jgi:hypothetical protein
MLMLCNNRINIIVYEHYNTAFFNLANSRQQESMRCPVRLGTQVPVPNVFVFIISTIILSQNSTRRIEKMSFLQV